MPPIVPIWLFEAAAHPGVCTLRMLMSHTSGLERQWTRRFFVTCFSMHVLSHVSSCARCWGRNFVILSDYCYKLLLMIIEWRWDITLASKQAIPEPRHGCVSSLRSSMVSVYGKVVAILLGRWCGTQKDWGAMSCESRYSKPSVTAGHLYSGEKGTKQIYNVHIFYIICAPLCIIMLPI